MTTRTSRLTRILAVALASVLAAALLPACIHVGIGNDADDLVTRRHAIEPHQIGPAEGAAPTLAVRPFESGRRYALRIIARDPDGEIEILDEERWAEAPRDALTVATRESLASCGRFETCIPATVNLVAGLTLDGDVLVCDLVRSADGPSSARLRLRLMLGDYATGTVLHSGVYTASQPLPGKDARGIGPAMSKATADVLRQALHAWSEAGVLAEE